MGQYINYPGFCKSRFGKAVLPAAYVAPCLMQAGIDMINGQPFTLDNMGFVAGTLGGLAGVFIHLPANRYASRHEYGMTRGSKLVKTWQAAVYSAVVAGGLALINTPDAPPPTAAAPSVPEKLTDFHN